MSDLSPRLKLGFRRDSSGFYFGPLEFSPERNSADLAGQLTLDKMKTDGLQCPTFTNLEMKLQAVSERHTLPALVTCPEMALNPVTPGPRRREEPETEKHQRKDSLAWVAGVSCLGMQHLSPDCIPLKLVPSSKIPTGSSHSNIAYSGNTKLEGCDQSPWSGGRAKVSPGRPNNSGLAPSD